MEAHLGVASPLGSRRYVRGVCEVDSCGALEEAMELVLAAVASDHQRSGLSTSETLHVDYGATVSNYCSLVSLRVINSTY